MTWDDATQSLVTVDLHGVIRRVNPSTGAVLAQHDTGTEQLHAVVSDPSQRCLVLAVVTAKPPWCPLILKFLPQQRFAQWQVNRLALSPEGDLVAELLDQLGFTHLVGVQRHRVVSREFEFRYKRC